MNEKIGIIKEIDNLGRIVIPKEMRERLFLDKKVEIILTKDGALIRNPEYILVKVEQESD
jgi:AbrB family looped-hinge helix DNA binding protein